MWLAAAVLRCCVETGIGGWGLCHRTIGGRARTLEVLALEICVEITSNGLWLLNINKLNVRCKEKTGVKDYSKVLDLTNWKHSRHYPRRGAWEQTFWSNHPELSWGVLCSRACWTSEWICLEDGRASKSRVQNGHPSGRWEAGSHLHIGYI